MPVKVIDPETLPPVNGKYVLCVCESLATVVVIEVVPEPVTSPVNVIV